MNNVLVKDIYIGDALAILVCESPHREEILNLIPLVGDSGLTVSQGLLANKFKAAGHQINDGDVKFSIVNTFEYARQLADKMKELNFAINKSYCNDINVYKSSLRTIYSTCNIVQFELRESYIARLRKSIELNERPIKLVICGAIAQAFFEYAMNIPAVAFGHEVKVKIFDQQVKVLYVQHPSPKAKGGFWMPNSSDNRKLMKYVYSS